MHGRAAALEGANVRMARLTAKMLVAERRRADMRLWRQAATLPPLDAAVVEMTQGCQMVAAM